MRVLLLASALVTALAIPAAAHADTFSFTPTGGSAITFSIPGGYPVPSLGFYSNYILVPIMDSGKTTINDNVTFYNPAAYSAFGEGPIDFFIHEDISQLNFYYTGAELYSGSEASPTFIPGTYFLDAAPSHGQTATGTLVIDGGAAATPEPSPLILLGTGLLEFAGVARRRFLKA